MRYVETISKRTHLMTPISVEGQVGSLATKVAIEKSQMLSEYLEHSFRELSEEYHILSRQFSRVSKPA